MTDITVLESEDYGRARNALAADPIVRDLARGIRLDDIRRLFHDDLSPRGDFMVAAMREYAERGGTVQAHIGGVAEAIRMVLCGTECGRTLRKDGRPWTCSLAWEQHIDGCDHEAYSAGNVEVTTWPYGSHADLADQEVAGSGTRQAETGTCAWCSTEQPLSALEGFNPNVPANLACKDVSACAQRQDSSRERTADPKFVVATTWPSNDPEVHAVGCADVARGLECHKYGRALPADVASAEAAAIWFWQDIIDEDGMTVDEAVAYTKILPCAAKAPAKSTQTSADGAVTPTPDGPDLEGLHAECTACGFAFKIPQRRATCQSEKACAKRRA
jgi:hypothetical protein